jgi:hypothetical protein
MICPRCDDERAAKIFEAPENGVWEVYRCPRCFFVWRNTEEDTVTHPELYDPKFKLDEKKIRGMAPKPPIGQPKSAKPTA